MGGGPYTYTQATADMKEIWQQLHRDVSAASYPTLFDSSTGMVRVGRHVDRRLARVLRAGRAPVRLGSLLEVAYTIEYGGEASVQSSLNMLYLLAYIGQGQMRILGPSNEKYHVRGGNDQITDRLAAALGDRVRLGSRLASIACQADGTWTLGFVQGTRRVNVRAERVVMTIRSRSCARWITRRPASRNARCRRSAARRRHERQVPPPVHGPDLGRPGQVRWDVLDGLPEHVGGDGGSRDARHPRRLHRRPLWRHVRDGIGDRSRALFFEQIDPVLPGLAAAWNGRGTIDHWPSQPLAGGSYSIGRSASTRIAGIEGRPEGSCHFAGEHTSIDFQGYLNGAVETGQRAATEVLDEIA